MTSDSPLPRPVEIRRDPSDFGPNSNTIHTMTMKANKGLEFPVVALPAKG